MRIPFAWRAVLVASVAALAACGRSPLEKVGPVSALAVRSGGADQPVILDRTRIDSVIQFLAATRGWRKSRDTPPNPYFSVRLMRDTMWMGTVWIGSNFVMARGRDPEVAGLRIRTASPGELSRLRSWLEVERADGPASACRSFVQGLYDALYSPSESAQRGSAIQRLLSRKPDPLGAELRDLLVADTAAQASDSGEINSVSGDFDPLSASQDPAGGYVAGTATQVGDSCDVPIFATRGVPGSDGNVLAAVLKNGAGEWRLVNIRYRDGKNLRTLLINAALGRTTFFDDDSTGGSDDKSR